MTISRKTRRVLELDGREYVWYVRPDAENFGAITLTVISEDRRFHVQYILGQSPEGRYVTVIGREFRDAAVGGVHQRFRSPEFGDGDTVTPRDVRSLVEWSLLPEPVPTRVDQEGRPVADDA